MTAITLKTFTCPEPDCEWRAGHTYTTKDADPFEEYLVGRTADSYKTHWINEHALVPDPIITLEEVG